MNDNLLGVRTFYFLAYHQRGVPKMDFDQTAWEDMAWVPKAKMNEYLTEERHSAFIDSLEHR